MCATCRPAVWAWTKPTILPPSTRSSTIRRTWSASCAAAAAKADTVYLAPDPDREGEAIAWHVAELIRDKAKDIKRIQFNEITARAVKEALATARAQPAPFR